MNAVLISNLNYTIQLHQLSEDVTPTGQLSVYPIAGANTELILTKSELPHSHSSEISRKQCNIVNDQPN